MKALLNWDAVAYALQPILLALCTVVMGLLAFLLGVFTLVWLPTVMGGVTMPPAWHTRVTVTGYILYPTIFAVWMWARYKRYRG